MATIQPPTAISGRLFDDSFLKFLPALLREPRRAWLAILTGVTLTLSGSILLSLVVQALAPGLASPEVPKLPAWAIIFAFVVFAPVVESIMMGGALALLLRWMPPAAAILTSAVGWAIFHSIQASAWGFIIWWPFLIFSTLFVVWRQRGFWAGVGVATATHMLQNLGPALALVYRFA